MSFRFWFYLTKIGGNVLLAAFVISMLLPSEEAGRIVRLVALGLLIPLGLFGAFLGIRLTMGELKMRCPFCDQPGSVGGSRTEGMWLECDDCGRIRGDGFLRLKIVRDALDDSGAVP